MSTNVSISLKIPIIQISQANYSIIDSKIQTNCAELKAFAAINSNRI